MCLSNKDTFISTKEWDVNKLHLFTKKQKQQVVLIVKLSVQAHFPKKLKLETRILGLFPFGWNSIWRWVRAPVLIVL